MLAEIRKQIVRLGFAAALAFVMPPQSAVAQQAQRSSGASDSPRHGVGLGFGEVLLMGDFATHFASGIGFNLNYSYEAGSTFGLLVNLHYNNHSNPSSPSDSLSIKGLTPNLKINFFTTDKLTVSALTGLGALLVSETYGNLNAGFTLFTVQAGVAANVELDPHFRFGPSFVLMKTSTGTDSSTVVSGSGASSSSSSGTSASSSSSAAQGATMGGMMFEIFFNVMYFF